MHSKGTTFAVRFGERNPVLKEPDLELLLLQLRAELTGERIDRRRHALASDVKAATAHGVRVAQTTEGWTAAATLDV
jgi:SHS2 domain-containing protein